MGADDFIRKPLSQRLLVERVKAVLRRRDASPKDTAAPKDTDGKVLERGHLRMDDERHSCTWKNEPVTFTVTEFLMLQSLLHEAPNALVYVDFLEADGERVFKHACRMGLEGVVAKRVDAPYRSGRQESWIKLKCVNSDTFPIVAFVEKLGAHPRKIASLYVGRREGHRVLYAGKARTGYTETVARELRATRPSDLEKISAVDPGQETEGYLGRALVDAEIEYSAVTDDGLLRVFKGLRDDLRHPRRAAIATLRQRTSAGGEQNASARSICSIELDG